MPFTDIDSTNRSDLANVMTDYSVDSMSTDGAFEQRETTWTNALWTQQFGYYKQIPEIRAVIDAKATWTVGKGYGSDPRAKAILDHITGWGKDTFNTILENLIRTYQIGGDSYAEIILDDDGDVLNLKVLDPATMVIVVDKQGLIKRYEQNSKVKGQPPKKFKTREIFHLARNRVADEIHGVSMIDALVDIILMKNEAMTDWKRVMHRNVDPFWIVHLDTDNEAKIKTFIKQFEQATAKGERLFVPKDIVVPELVATATNASLNPLTWIDSLDNKFYEAAGVPKIILGGSGEFTEASAKIAYLAFQQNIEEEQLFVEEQVLNQLNLVINLEFPASLENELLSDEQKDGGQQTQPNETTAGSGQ